MARFPIVSTAWAYKIAKFISPYNYIDDRIKYWGKIARRTECDSVYDVYLRVQERIKDV